MPLSNKTSRVSIDANGTISGSRLRIALEPEAAAFYCQYEKTQRERSEFSSVSE